MKTNSQKAIQALNILKSIAEDAPIKLTDHQIANQAAETIFKVLQEQNGLIQKSDTDNKSESIFTNMDLEELEVVFSSGKKTIPHSGYPRCCLIKSVSQSIEAGAGWSDVKWDSIDYDNDNMHSIVLNHERATIHKKGICVFEYKIRIQINDKVSCNTRLIKNGSELIPRSGITITGSKDCSIITPHAKTPMIELEANDYIVLQIQHDDKSAKNIFPNDTYLSCEKRY